MTALSLTEKKRLAKLLGMLGSDHPGERDNAAVKAHQLVKAKDVTWSQVIDPPPPIETPLPELGTWRTTVAECLAKPGSLRRWEIGFLQELPKFRRISVKQRYCLKEIADRVLGMQRR